MKKQREGFILKDCLAWLRAQPDTKAWRNYSIGVPNGKGEFRPNFNRGLPDITGVKKGKAFALEVKVPGGQLTPHQRSWLRDFAEAGGYASKVESVEDVQLCFGEI